MRKWHNVCTLDIISANVVLAPHTFGELNLHAIQVMPWSHLVVHEHTE